MTLAILFIAAILALFYYKFVKPLKYFEEKGINHEPGWPLIGNMGLVTLRKEHRWELNENLYQKHSNKRYVGYFKFTVPQILLRDLDLIKEIAIKHFEHFHDHLSFNASENDEILGKSLLRLSGEKWKEMRATISPAFTGSKLRNMFKLIDSCATNFTNNLKNVETDNVEMKGLVTRFSTDIVASTAYGIQVDSLKDPDNVFYTMGKSLISFNIVVLVRVFFLHFLPHTARKLHIGLFPLKVMNFFRTIVKDNITNRKKNNIFRPDLIHLMMEAQKGQLNHDETDETTGFASVQESHIGKTNKKLMQLTNDHIAAQALTFFFNTFETASTAACFTAHELAVNPEIQKKLQAEIDQVKESNPELDYETLLNMKYLDQVLSESLRMWPPTFETDRLCTRDFILKSFDKTEKSVVIEKGVVVRIPIMAIHRDPKYFPEPHRFDPERFSDENKPRIVPGSYLPFGTGPRNCIGSRFALLTVKALLFHLLAEFDLEASSSTAIPMQTSKKSVGVEPKNGFNLALKSRK